MSRQFGLNAYPANWETQYASTLDARILAESMAQITTAGNFVGSTGADYAYIGMTVIVINDSDEAANGVYRLNDLDYTVLDNWKRLAVIDSLILDYQTDLTSYPTVNGQKIIGDMDITDLMFSFLSAKVVTELPALDEALLNTVYLILSTDPETPGQYDEFLINIVEFEGEELRNWEQIGRTVVDLSNLYTMEELELLRTFTQDPTALTYTSFGYIDANTTSLTGISLQELIERLFFAIVEPVITRYSYETSIDTTVLSVGETATVTVDFSYEQGAIHLDGNYIGPYTGEATSALTVDGVAVSGNSFNALGVTANTPITIVQTITFAAGEITPLRSNGSVATGAAFAGATITQTYTIEVIGAVQQTNKSGVVTYLPSAKIDLVDKYIEITCDAYENTIISMDSSYYGDIYGIQMFNGATGEWEFLYGDATLSLAAVSIDYNITIGNIIITWATMLTGEKTIRICFRSPDYYVLTTNAVTGVVTVTLSEAMIQAIISDDSVMFGSYTTGDADLPALDIDSTTALDLSSLFSDSRLQAMDELPSVSSFNSLNVVNASGLYADCSISEVDLTGFDIAGISSTSGMFDGCSEVTAYCSDANVASYEALGYNDADSIVWFIAPSSYYTAAQITGTDITLIGLNSQYKDALNAYPQSRYKGAAAGELVKLRSVDTTWISLSGIFANCTLARGLDLTAWDTSNVVNMSYMFYLCYGIESITGLDFDTSAVTNMSYMFYQVSTTTTLDVSSFDTSLVTNMAYMFYNCTAVRALDVDSFITSNVLSLESTFYSCIALTTIDLSGWDISKVASFASIFYRCDCVCYCSEDNIAALTAAGTSTDVTFATK